MAAPTASDFTKALLASLARGIATTKIKDVPAGGEVTLSALDFSSGAGELFSIEGSFNLDWPEPTLDEIRVDQGLQTIAMDVDKGDISFSANYPAVAEAALKYFFKNDEVSATITTEAAGTSTPAVTYTGTSFFIQPKTAEVSIAIEDQDQKYCITMARVALTARLAYDADNKIWYIGLNGRVLTNLKAGEADMVVAARNNS